MAARLAHVLLVVLLCLALAPDSGGLILSSSGSDSTGRDGLTVDPQWDGVGVVYGPAEEGPNFTQYGTGVLIAPQYVLTVAHAFFEDLEDEDEPADPGDVFFLVGGELRAVERYVEHPDYDPDTSYCDLAVLELAEPVENARSYRINGGEVDELKTGECVIVGCGLTGSAIRGLDTRFAEGVKRMATNTVDAISDGSRTFVDGSGEEDVHPADMLLIDFDDHRTPAVNGVDRPGYVRSKLPGKGTNDPTEGITTPGDSGCPMFQRAAGGEWIVVGIGSGGVDEAARVGDIAEFTRLRRFHAFIVEWAGLGRAR